MVHRRGYPPSPLARALTFDVDGADLAPLLASRPHIVAHSHSVLGTLIAASRTRERVRSLTLIESPVFHLVPRRRRRPGGRPWKATLLVSKRPVTFMVPRGHDLPTGTLAAVRFGLGDASAVELAAARTL
jgi:hypothetical protein